MIVADFFKFLVNDPRLFWFVMLGGFFLLVWIGLYHSGKGQG